MQDKMEIGDDLDDISEDELPASDKDDMEEDEESEEDEEDEPEDVDEERELAAVDKKASSEAIIESDMESEEEAEKMEVATELSSAEPQKLYEQTAESSAIEASEVLMELASIFADSNRLAVMEPRVEEQIDTELQNGDIDYDSEATMSADEGRDLRNMPIDSEDRNIRTGSVASQLISEHSYCLPLPTPVKEPYRHRPLPVHIPAAEPKLATIDSVIDLVARGPKPKPIVADHEYTKMRATTPPFVRPLSPVMVSPHKRTKVKRKHHSSRSSHREVKDVHVDIRTPEPLPYVGYDFPKRTVIDEMIILYDFLKNGLDQEDTTYLQMSYDAMLQDDASGFWLNDTHWVDYPDILLIFVLVIVKFMEIYILHCHQVFVHKVVINI